VLAKKLATEEKLALDEKKSIVECLALSEQIANAEKLAGWIYATLIFLHTPLEPYTHSILRDIAKV
jgi:replicative superfamily II helicase